MTKQRPFYILHLLLLTKNTLPARYVELCTRSENLVTEKQKRCKWKTHTKKLGRFLSIHTCVSSPFLKVSKKFYHVGSSSTYNVWCIKNLTIAVHSYVLRLEDFLCIRSYVTSRQAYSYKKPQATFQNPEFKITGHHKYKNNNIFCLFISVWRTPSQKKMIREIRNDVKRNRWTTRNICSR